MEISFGALAPHIGEQVPELTQEHAMRLEGHRNAIDRLRINGLITRADAVRAEKRLVKEVAVTVAILRGQT